MSFDIEDFEFALERRFGAYLPAGQSLVMAPTPRGFAAQLAGRRTKEETSVSLTVRAFMRIRAKLAEQTSMPLSRIRPDTRCEELMPDPNTRRAQWEAFRQWLGVREVPGLVRSKQVGQSITHDATGASIAAAVAAFVLLPAAPLVPIALLAFGGAGALGLHRTSEEARWFTAPDLTVGALAHYAVAYGSPILGDAVLPTTTSQALEIILPLARFEIGAPVVRADATWAEIAALGHPN